MVIVAKYGHVLEIGAFGRYSVIYIHIVTYETEQLCYYYVYYLYDYFCKVIIPSITCDLDIKSLYRLQGEIQDEVDCISCVPFLFDNQFVIVFSQLIQGL